MMQGFKIFTDLEETESDKKQFNHYFDQLIFGNELKDGIYKTEAKLEFQTISIQKGD